ncbi:ABC-type sugar transport system, periplasmic component [Lacticaseibacillus nasuensis JCM 17158]|uniref:ABC-type sugar transport system, periplasmic component n=2 Tax=Lacticaseibacillus TaxID=2759736 RepID=A0A0R1JML7_9LACO|nr:ABC transporter substrate-binding protein [Lacticaseibacillus nasuensis]KRK72543.1 ABC-type sugar transport system, periplasmic component [Lacticaseibacillus nasuensis JCM 17158]
MKNLMNKHWGKSLLAIGAAAVMAITLAACGSSSKSGANQKVQITFWHGMNGVYNKALQGIITDFNKSQDKYVVKGTAQGNYTALQQKIMAAAKSKKLPTIAQTTYTTVPDYVNQGFITPLDPYMLKGSDKLTSADKSDIYSTFLTSSKYDGKYYSMPFSKSVRIMFYNKDLMQKLGVKTIPTSWEDMAKLGKQLKSKGVAVVGFDQSFDMELDGLIHQAGTSIVTKNLKVNADSKKVLTATHVIWDMIHNGEAKTAGSDFYGDRNFTSGKTLFYIGSSAGVSSMKANAPKSLNWATTPLPSYLGQKGTELAGNDIVMFKSASTEQQKGAWAFMKFLTSKKETTKWAEKTGYVPLRKSAVTSSSYQAYLKQDPTAKAAVDSLDFGFQAIAFKGFTEYRTDVLNAVDAMLTKKQTPEKAMGDLQTSVEKIIQENK